MPNKLRLTAVQRQEWKKWAAGIRAINHRTESYELEFYRDIHYFAPPEYLEGGVSGGTLLFVLMAHPQLTEELVLKLLKDQLINDRGNCISELPRYCEILHRHGVDVLQGRTGWLVELLARGVTDWPRFYMHFYSGDLFSGMRKWLLEGGYHQTPMIEVFPYATTAYHRAVEREKWEEKWLNRYWEYVDPIFNFRDPENLPPEKSPYYAFAAYAQDYLCHQIEMPRPIADALTARLRIKSLAEFKCLPLLPRPIYEIPVPTVAEPKASGKKAKDKEPEVYDEFYEQQGPDPKHPYPTPRFYATTDLKPDVLINALVDEFTRRKFLTRKVKPKQCDVSGLLSAKYVKKPPESWNAQLVAFKTHPRFAMNDEFEVWIRLIASAAPLTIANGEYNDNVRWKLIVEDDQCNVVISIDAPGSQLLENETSAMKNLWAILKSLSTTLGIKFKESKPPEILDSWEV